MTSDYDGSKYTAQILEFGNAFQRLIKEHMTEDSEIDLSAIVASALGVVSGQYWVNNNPKGEQATIAAHDTFCDVFYRSK